MTNKGTVTHDSFLGLIEGRTFKQRMAENKIGHKFTMLPIVIAVLIIAVGQYKQHIQPIINYYTPIVTDVTYEPVLITPKRVILRLVAVKGLEAKYVKDSETGQVWDGNLWREVKFQFLEDPSPGSSRPAHDEPQSLGKWEWSGKLGEITQVRATVQHLTEVDIHEVWIDGVQTKTVTGTLRETTFGPFDVTPYGKLNQFTK